MIGVPKETRSTVRCDGLGFPWDSNVMILSIEGRTSFPTFNAVHYEMFMSLPYTCANTDSLRRLSRHRTTSHLKLHQLRQKSNHNSISMDDDAAGATG
jgi:hypothetical protein